MGFYNHKHSRSKGDNLLNRIEISISELVSNTEKLKRDGDEFYFSSSITEIKDCVTFGNIILEAILRYEVSATLVFTLSKNGTYDTEVANKLKIGLAKTKFIQKNTIGYIE